MLSKLWISHYMTSIFVKHEFYINNVVWNVYNRIIIYNYYRFTNPSCSTKKMYCYHYYPRLINLSLSFPNIYTPQIGQCNGNLDEWSLKSHFSTKKRSLESHTVYDKRIDCWQRIYIRSVIIYIEATLQHQY